jgi:hypothetical protein
MTRGRIWMLVVALVAVLVVLGVFRVRVFLAGGKALLAVGIILLLLFVCWPRSRR